MEVLEVVKSLTVTLVIVGSLLINPLCILGISRSKSLKKEALTPLTFSVFVADCAQALFLGPFSIYFTWTETTNPPLWLVRIQAFCLVGDVANISSVTLLSLWQTIGIVRPLTFASFASKKKIWGSVALAWIWAFSMAILRVSSHEVFYNVANRYVIIYMSTKCVFVYIHSRLYLLFITSLAHNKMLFNNCFKRKQLILLDFLTYNFNLGSYSTFRNTSIRKSHVSAQLLQMTILSMLALMVVCHVIMFVVVVRQHVKMRKLVATSSEHAPSPVLLAMKSAKKILALTVTYIVLNIARFIGVYVKNSHARFFFMWINYSQSFWNSVFYLTFSAAAWRGIKRLFCKSGTAEDTVITNPS